MKKIFNYLVLAFMTVLIGSQVFIYADSAGIKVKPDLTSIDTQIKYEPTYASLNFYTSIPTYYNLSTTSFQVLKPFSIGASSSNLTTNTVNGTVTIGNGAGGLYKVTLRMSIKASEGSTIHFQTIKNWSIINKTFRRMSQGPIRTAYFLNQSTTGGSSQDVYVSSDSSTYTLKYTNFTSTQKALQAINHADGMYYHINEGNATPGFLVRVGFNNIDEPKQIILENSAYDGSNHKVKLQAYNFTFTRYTSLTNNGTDFTDSGSIPGLPGEYVGREFGFPTPYKQYVNNNTSLIRINHTSPGSTAHDFEIDQLTLQDALDAYYMEHTEIYQLNDGDVVSIRIGSDTPNTSFYGYVRGLKLDRIGR